MDNLGLIQEFVKQYATLFVVLGAIAGILGLAFTIYKASTGRHIQHLKDRIAELAGKDLVADKLREEQRQLKTKLEKSCQDLESADARIRGLGLELVTCEQDKQALTHNLARTEGELVSWEKKECNRSKVMAKAMSLEGKIWERPVRSGTPRFRSLSDRHAAIISVLNIKGGVGKTTITANLAAALSRKGYRVLLVDLDLQGSLSSLFVHETDLLKKSADGQLLQHFLLSTAQRRKANLLDYCVPIFDGKSAIVPTTDSMTYAELNLTMACLLRTEKRDARFLMRRGLHQKRIASRYDIVLLDCPPLFNTCCVNALAASDYVVTPVLPSEKSIERVPLLLNRVKRLHHVINPELQVLGLLYNRTRGAELSALERDMWREMLSKGQDQWKLPVPAFETFIRHSIEVRDNENEFALPAVGSEMETTFAKLVNEMEERLPHDCRRIANPALELV